MNAIILAGGLGTRLHPITKDKYPKCMVDVNGKPFLEHLIRQISKFNIGNIYLSVGHKADSIEKYFSSYYDGINLLYYNEEEPLGTGGAIKFVLKSINLLYGSFIILNGDTFTTIDLNKMMKFHKEKKALVTIAVKYVGNVSRFGNIIFDKNGKMLEYIEKPGNMPGYINTGAYIVEQEMEEQLSEKGSFEKDFLQKSAAGVYAFEDSFDFIDIGIPKDYKKFCKEEKID